MNNTLYLLQPGKLGDILICSTIAKYYHNLGYKIVWPVFDNFIPTIERFDFVEPMSFGCSLTFEEYYSNKNRAGFAYNRNFYESKKFFSMFYNLVDKNKLNVIDPCFSFPGHVSPLATQKIKHFTENNRNWIDLKFHLANVPLLQRWNFSFKRDIKKEEELLKYIQDFSMKKYGSKNYNLVHTYSSLSPPEDITNIINFSYIKGYEIFDWFGVIQNSDNIFCCDSSLCNFIEVIPEFKEKNKFYLGTEEKHYHSYMRNILLNNWNNLSIEKDLNYSEFLR